MTTPRPTVPTSRLTRFLAGIVALLIIVMPFHAFLTIWIGTTIGHYTAIRLWKEALLAVLIAGAGYVLLKDKPLRREFFRHRLHQLMLGYTALTLVWGVVAYGLDKVTLKALGYGYISNLRFIAFFLAVWILARASPILFARWPKWLLWPLLGVIAFGLLQYLVLPYDFLKHFGYGQQTIFPYSTINHNIDDLRVFSTLRGANPLGAYLLLVISVLLALWRGKLRSWRGALLAVAGIVVYLSFSRSAAIGLALSLAVIIWYSLRSDRVRKTGLLTVAGCIVVGASALFVLRDNTTVQNVVFHTNDTSTISVSSNDGHASALKSGLQDIAAEPLGQGVGTAGPASVYNQGKARIAENYFIQIGQEIGWLGMLLFIAITICVGWELWRRRHNSLALGLLGALIGLTFVNLLSHAWTDDTLAYLFWGLAGIALASKATHTRHA